MLRSFTLLALLCAAPALAGPFDDLTPEDRAALGAEIRDYLLENPEILNEVTAILSQRERDTQIAADRLLVEANEVALADTQYNLVAGNPEGDVTIVEFIDYQCSFCKRAHPEVEQLLAQDGNIRLILREFPILGPMSEAASRAATAVLINQGPEVYAGFSEALITYQGQLNAAVINRLAAATDVDVTQMEALSSSNEVTQVIARNHQLARALQITGTPTFVFGDEMIRGYMPLQQMQAVVQAQRDEM